MFNLSDKVALITGASSGIGAGCAKVLASQGATVVLAARRADKLNKLAQEISDNGGKAMVVEFDVLSKESIDKGVSQVVEKYQKIDILVNNAGVVSNFSVVDMKEEDWDKVLDTNIKGDFLVTQRVVKEMMKNKKGRIVNISSIAMGGQGVGFPYASHYCASKGAVVAYTESLSAELAPFGILVNCVAPGVIQSEMTQGMIDNPQQLAGFMSRIPLKRVGTPEEIAAAVVFLASDEASYVTGSTLVVDGGWLAS